jgi:integrase
MKERQADSKAQFGDFLRADWYMFAGKVATKPVTAWRTAWRSMLKEAKIPHTRFYNTRHTAITDLLQNPAASEETVKSIAGHVSRKMLERYSHTRIDAKRKAVESLSKQGTATVLLQSGNSAASNER